MLLFYKKIELRKARKMICLRLEIRALFLTLATFPRVWIRPSKHRNHEVILSYNTGLDKMWIYGRTDKWRAE